MKKMTVRLLCVTTALLGAQAFSAQDMNQTDTGTIQVEQRQHAFKQIETFVDKADDTLNGSDTDWAALSSISLNLANHSQELMTIFPAGSQEGSKAKDTVWTKPEKFNQLMKQMNEGFAKLHQASKRSDVSLAELGLETAQDTCKSCHRSYRSRW
ncbi:c-type cytochrome [Vibrio gallaecicus]|uniref:c-type cytochrome n=1 Tax=Vibrio gallaecicus TaxID=552386 RepID=UPI0010C9F89D|nr:cytochrome c [Vibrio gallaecicus]MDN3617601.1 cytochrome c [Vibrio gallaecicus]